MRTNTHLFRSAARALGSSLSTKSAIASGSVRKLKRGLSRTVQDLLDQVKVEFHRTHCIAGSLEVRYQIRV
tara:strand:- start:2545 stop:2757 length:213 start_codon:yes stop_codon:yes gene_type:complete